MTELVARRAQRASMRRPATKNPILRASACFVAAGAFAATQVVINPQGDDFAWLYAVAVVATVAGILVLMRSAAIRRINALQITNKVLQDELARDNLYLSQLSDTLRAAKGFRAMRNADRDALITTVMDTAVARYSAVLAGSVRLCLVRAASDSYVLRRMVGTRGFPIGEGKACPADQPLVEVVAQLAKEFHVVALQIAGQEHALVLLADTPLTPVDRGVLETVASALELVLAESTPPVRLHAV